MKKVFFFVLLLAFFQSKAQKSVMDFYVAKIAQVAEINASEPEGSEPLKLLIKKQDIPNGFLACSYDPPLGYLIGVVDSPLEMAYFIAKNGKKFMASVEYNKLATGDNKYIWACQGVVLESLENGKLKKFTDKALEKVQKDLMDKAPDGRNFWAKVPQVGTVIQMGYIDPAKGESSFVISRELHFNLQDGSFKEVKK